MAVNSTKKNTNKQIHTAFHKGLWVTFCVRDVSTQLLRCERTISITARRVVSWLCDAGWPAQESDIPNQMFSSLKRWKRFLRSLCYENQTIKDFNFTQDGPVMLQTQIPFSGLCRPTGRHTGAADLATKEWVKKPQHLTAVSMIILLLYLLAITSFR